MAIMKLRQRMERLLAANSNASDQKLASDLLSQVRKADLLQLVAEEFQHLRRAHVQRLEQKALQVLMSQTRPRKASAALAADFEAMRELMDRKYADGTGRRMRFGAMTTAEHQACIDQAMTQINAQQQRIALHQRAIRIIETAGVICLDEVDAVDKAA
jgi:hypothetical protein